MAAQRPSLPIPTPVSVVATGAYLKNRACLIHDAQVQWSRLHGNLDESASCITLEGVGYGTDGKAWRGEVSWPVGVDIGGARACPGDVILVSGTMGDHGVAIMASRESLSFETTIESDSAALHTLVADLLRVLPGEAVHVLRDPTRGGLASTLNEIARQSGVGMLLEEEKITGRK